VTFETISDAQAVVKAGKVYQGRTLSFDFVNEPRGANQKERRASDSGREGDGRRGRSRSPPRVRQIVRLSRSPSRRRRSRSPRKDSLSPARKRSRSWSKKRSPTPDISKSSNKRSSSSSSSSSSSRSSSKSAKKVQKKASSADNRQAGDDDEEEQAVHAVVELAERVDDDQRGCRDCNHLLRDLQRHVTDHHAESGVAIQKATIKAWFEAHYSRRGNNAGENAAAVGRSTLIKEINSFLESMGWPTWKTQSPMYKDWFLREVMGLSDDDIKKQRNWSLFHKDGFAPKGNVENARNKEQRLAEMVEKLRQYMNL
jgi:hypothetical protein